MSIKEVLLLSTILLGTDVIIFQIVERKPLLAFFSLNNFFPPNKCILGWGEGKIQNISEIIIQSSLK